VRINPGEPRVPAGQQAVAAPARAALVAMASHLDG
jgi:hypothetical protein